MKNEQQELQKRLDSQVKERVEAIEQGVKNQLKALENEQASQRTQMMQLFGDVDKKMQEDRKAVEQAHGVLKASLETLGKNTEVKFAAIQQSLEEQAKATQESKGGVKQQLEDFGAQLMAQIANLQPEKRRKGESSDADMRGGMTPSQVSCGRESTSSSSSSSSGSDSSGSDVNLVCEPQVTVLDE